MKEIMEMIFRPLIVGWEILWTSRTWPGRVIVILLALWIGPILVQLLWMIIVLPMAFLGFLYRTFQYADKGTRKEGKS